ncbi:MAG: tetratricopeptide repeat protein [Bryobacterales bacterium]|nr:tetratricopeptide repeat protein [Bryobacterales bacterium]
MSAIQRLSVSVALCAALWGGAPRESFDQQVAYGSQLHKSGRHKDALRYFKKMLRDGAGDERAERMVVLAWLGTVNSDLERWTEAERALLNCLAIRDELWSATNGSDPLHARVLSSLGSVEIKLGKQSQANRHLKAASEIWARVGDSDSQLAAHWNNVAFIALTQKRYTEAAAGFRKAVALFEGDTQPDDRDLARARLNLARALSHLSLHAEADTYSRKALEGFQAGMDREPALAAELISVRCEVLRRAKRGHEAKELSELLNHYLAQTESRHRVDVSTLMDQGNRKRD